MAEWTNIATSNLEPGKPARSIDALALRDNPIAIAEGAAGAPRILNNALLGPVAGTAFIICELNGPVEIGFASGYLNPSRSKQFDNGGAHIGVDVLVAGTITCSVDHASNTAAGGGSEVRILKNGTPIGTWATTSASFITRQVSVSVDVGDRIIFQQRVVSPAAGRISQWRNVRILSNNNNFAVA